MIKREITQEICRKDLNSKEKAGKRILAHVEIKNPKLLLNILGHVECH